MSQENTKDQLEVYDMIRYKNIIKDKKKQCKY